MQAVKISKDSAARWREEIGLSASSLAQHQFVRSLYSSRSGQRWRNLDGDQYCTGSSFNDLNSGDHYASDSPHSDLHFNCHSILTDYWGQSGEDSIHAFIHQYMVRLISMDGGIEVRADSTTDHFLILVLHYNHQAAKTFGLILLPLTQNLTLKASLH